MAGASGFLGTALSRCLVQDGHEVTRLVRRLPSDDRERMWDPAAGLVDPAVLADANVVINLAGTTVSRRWTSRYRQSIRTSRIDPTTTLATALAALPPGQRTLLNASAIGFYGETGDRCVDEGSPAGQGFLAEVCRVWEAATRPAEDAGVRVVHLRTGLPLGRSGGLLAPMLPLYKLGLGTRLGSGRQYWPWISMGDWLGAVRFLLGRDDLAGPVNLVGPAPATNAEFTRVLGGLLGGPIGRQLPLAVPAPVLRAALGGFAIEVLGRRRVLPAVLTSAGYEFEHPDLETALQLALAD